VAADGSCIRPGVPPGGCSPGFTYDGNGGCDPILPAMDCGEGEMAVPGDTECHAVGAAGEPPTCPSGQVALPGETACHDLADCGSGTWGNIPVDATTQYVDASYTGGASDGTAAKPWTTIGAAVTAAASGAIVAVASGSYAESVTLAEKTVRLWGRCPGMVEIAGTGAAAVALAAGTHGTELHTIALTGAGLGAILGTATGVVLDSVWVHDTAQGGVDANGQVKVTGSLVERTISSGIRGEAGANLTVGTTVVRDVAPAQDGMFGRGMEIDPGGILEVGGSLLENNRDAQMIALGAVVSVRGCVLRDGLPQQSDMQDGDGIVAVYETGRSTVTVRASTIERSTSAGILLTGSDAFVTGTLVRDTRADAADGTDGYAIAAVVDTTSKQPSRLRVVASLMERSLSAGILAQGAALSMAASVARDTVPSAASGLGGPGVVAVMDPTTHVPSSLALTGSVIERASEIGLDVEGSTASVEATLVRDTAAGSMGAGYGVQVGDDAMTGAPASLTFRGGVITGNRGDGVAVFSSDVTIDTSVVSWTQLGGMPAGGYGLFVGADAKRLGAHRSTLTLERSTIANTISLAVLVTESDATLAQVWIRDVASLPDGTVGDGLDVSGTSTLGGSNVRIENTARAGIAMFDTSVVTLASATLACNAIPLDAEETAAFTSGGNVVCSCGATTSACQVLSSDLQPPSPIAQSGSP